jgi:hypothetical protein
MVGLGLEELGEGHELSDNRAREHAVRGQLLVCLDRRPALLLVVVEDDLAVFGPDIRPLTIECRGVVARPENFE